MTPARKYLSKKEIVVGNLREELRLARFMPDEFKQCCPVCKSAWTYDRIDFYGERIGLSCQTCERWGGDHFKDPNRFHWRNHRTQHFVPNQIETAWNKLWRSFCMSYGLRLGILLTGGESALQKAIQIAQNNAKGYRKMEDK